MDEKNPIPNNLDNITEKYFCPECGTIKNNNDICLHCGFDPKPAKTGHGKTLKYTGIMLGVIAIVIIAYLLALPSYNIYTNKNKIASGLKLAFDTRDTITAFILKTNFWPNQNIDANLDKKISNEVIESIVVSENAVMTVTIRAKVLNSDSSKTIIFKPALSKSKLVWNCAKGTLDSAFRPDMCKSAI